MLVLPGKHRYTLRHAQGHHRVFLGFPIEGGNLKRDVPFMQVWIPLIIRELPFEQVDGKFHSPA